jgi:hypothetical protein
MGDDLVALAALAKRLVEISEEATRIKGELRRLLGDGPSPRPTKPPSALNGAGGQAAKWAKAAEADQAVLDFIRDSPAPLRQTEIATRIGAAMSTTGNRLVRLQRAGAIQRNESGLWSAVTPTTPVAVSTSEASVVG